MLKGDLNLTRFLVTLQEEDGNNEILRVCVTKGGSFCPFLVQDRALGPWVQGTATSYGEPVQCRAHDFIGAN